MVLYVIKFGKASVAYCIHCIIKDLMVGSNENTFFILHLKLLYISNCYILIVS